MGTNYLFVIGISKYNVPKYSKLKNAVNDANAIINVLEKRYGFEKHQYLLDENATRENIINAFAELKNLLNKDNLIIFFAGHGDQDIDTKQGYMIPIDGDKLSQYISYADIKASIEHIKAQHILLIFDCCFPANFISRTRSSIQKHSSIDKIYALSSRYFLGAGGEEPVSDGGNEDNSPFTSSIVDILAKNQEKALPASSLALSVRKHVGDLKKQQPVFETIDVKGHTVGGEFVFFLKDGSDSSEKQNKNEKSENERINREKGIQSKRSQLNRIKKGMEIVDIIKNSDAYIIDYKNIENIEALRTIAAFEDEVADYINIFEELTAVEKIDIGVKYDDLINKLEKLGIAIFGRSIRAKHSNGMIWNDMVFKFLKMENGSFAISEEGKEIIWITFS